MNKINNLSVLLMLLVFVGFTACSEDDLSTNQYGKGVKLSAYGPQPVIRGGTLRFLGSNLDQIKEVRIPGVDPITAIDVRQAGIPSEIHVQVPKDGPEEGYVTLVTATGEEITTKTKLTYEESIEFESFSPVSVMPGEVLTIKGDYLNLIHQVLFSTEMENATSVTVNEDQFTVHTRYEIQVFVPAEACSGKIILSDGDEEMPNWIYSEEALNVGTPSVSAFASPRGEAEPAALVVVKMGETVTVSGSSLGLIAGLRFGADDNVFEFDEFEVNESGTVLTYLLPEEAPDGDFSLVCRSGVVVPVGLIETVAPGNCVAAPAPVKAGASLTVTGADMDVVSAVEMPNVADEIAFTKADDGTKVVVTAVPETAQEGNLVLRMKNGKGTEVPFTLVQPVVTGYDNATVSAGGELTINGTDLDLVKTVQFGEYSDVVEVGPAEDGKSITLTVPMNAASGEPILGLVNGTTVTGIALSIEEAVFCYATELPGDDAEIKAGSVLTLPVMNIDKLTGVQINGIDCQVIQAENALHIGIPTSAGSNSMVRLISSNGEVTYTINFIPASEVSKVVWSGMTEITWGAGGRVIIPASAFESVPAGAVMTLCYTQKDQVWAQAQINYADWSGINFTEGDYQFSQTIVPTNDEFYGWFTDGILNRETPVVLTQEILDNILAKRADCDDENAKDCGIIIQGSDLIFTKVTISYTQSLEQNLVNCIVRQDDQNTLMPFPIGVTWGDDGRFRILIDRDPSIKDMKLVAGKSTMYFYVTGTGQLQINDANWASFLTLAEWEDASERVMELVLTQEIIDWLKGVKSDGWSSTGLIIQGDGMTVSKITILP